MDNQEFQALLLKYRQGKCTLEESLAIHLWYERMNKDADVSMDEQEEELVRHRILSTVNENIQARELPVSHIWWKRRHWYSVAAAATILIGMYFSILSYQRNKEIGQFGSLFVEAGKGEFVVQENKTTKDKAILLEDSSIVTLAPASKIIYASHFSNSKRDVQLIGDAFFQITKNPEKPFIVYNGKIATKVLGTSFRMKTNASGQFFQVEVVTGKVSVSENKAAFSDKESAGLSGNSNGVILTPNQRVRYFPEKRDLIVGLVDNPVMIAGDFHDSLKYNNKHIEDIAADLQAIYGIEIVFSSEVLKKCTFTGDISDMPLFKKLDLLCKSNQFTYEVKGTKILISGSGCD